MNNTRSPFKFLNRQSKDKKVSNHKKSKKQLETILSILQQSVSTTASLSKATGIKVSVICRYKRDLEHLNAIHIIGRTRCETTGYLADHYTAIPRFQNGIENLLNKYHEEP